MIDHDRLGVPENTWNPNSCVPEPALTCSINILICVGITAPPGLATVGDEERGNVAGGEASQQLLREGASQGVDGEVHADTGGSTKLVG